MLCNQLIAQVQNTFIYYLYLQLFLQLFMLIPAFSQIYFIYFIIIKCLEIVIFPLSHQFICSTNNSTLINLFCFLCLLKLLNYFCNEFLFVHSFITLINIIYLNKKLQRSTLNHKKYTYTFQFYFISNILLLIFYIYLKLLKHSIFVLVSINLILLLIKQPNY
ncbi:transmembrane protein, putative (macronuclear) [Tetrahymena thermophila SB210]|uniref:Transmembrane protein, putative n=1 Tax=Tetrahymena thermophila (strain SB210) TaxID=312017 RepID=W7XED7_TETTS|nr:transmembrane protein, putative [Tetrahymena thermophila SB210]EWS74968.1 transmembrane protein, putative [Tetrahymena thermophila SB210]|eukprot:XP_012652509.1 transmembrane protein, putative [Tetrahymena thermophila SB210]